MGIGIELWEERNQKVTVEKNSVGCIYHIIISLTDFASALENDTLSHTKLHKADTVE